MLAWTPAKKTGANAPATPVLLADVGNTEKVTVLIQAGAEVNAKSDDGRTAASRANEYGHAEIAQALRRAGAKI